MAEIPTACVLRISDEKTMQLLDLYRQEECLWNTNNEFYRDQLHRRQAAEKIACLLDIPNFGPRHVLTKFKNLRNAYSQELKKIARHEAAGLSYKPTVFWYRKMDAFIKPHLQKPRGSHSRSQSLICHVDGNEEWLQDNAIPEFILKTEIEEVTSENDSTDSQTKKRKLNLPNRPNKVKKILKSDSESEEINFIEISIPQSSENDEKDRIDSNESIKIDGNRTIDQSIKAGNRVIDKAVKDYIDSQQKDILRSFQDLSSSIRALSSRDDVFDSFGNYVAGLLRTLPRNKALEVQPLIVDLITQVGLQVHGDVKDRQLS